MQIARFVAKGDDTPRIGLLEDGGVRTLTSVAGLAGLLSTRLARCRELVEEASRDGATPIPAGEVELLAPLDGRMEVWAAGVTYETSREARIEESKPAADVYELVYDAERPELFFKSAGWRVRGNREAIALREDSDLDIPEPEVALVLNRFAEIVGLTVCNDVSSRSIEGANPLYLPQAKTYLGACAVGPAVRPIWEISDPYSLTIALEIGRGGEVTWRGEASTRQLRRRFDDIAGYLFRADIHPDGVILTTGTCLVPPLPFTLQADDVVRIEVGEVGILENPVVRGLSSALGTSRSQLRPEAPAVPRPDAPAGG
jgi:2-dehydro-3-deoxy-D-arabinonate dehydratase